MESSASVSPASFLPPSAPTGIIPPHEMMNGESERVGRAASSALAALNRPALNFEEYKISLSPVVGGKFSFTDECNTKRYKITEPKDIEEFLTEALHLLCAGSLAINVNFWGYWERKVSVERRAIYQQFDAAKKLQFIIPNQLSSTLILRLKPEKVEAMGNGKTRFTYANGIIEERKENFGRRLFPNGVIEQGRFDIETGQLCSGYRLDRGEKIQLVNPPFLAEIHEKSNGSKSGVIEIERKLFVIEKKDQFYKFLSIPIETHLLNVAAKKTAPPVNRGHIIEVLTHDDFKNRLIPFIRSVLAPDASRIPRLFGFSNVAAAEILSVAVEKNEAVDPLKMVNPTTQRNFFVQIAHEGDTEFLTKLIQLFPGAFQIAGQEVIAEFLRQGHDREYAMTLAEKFGRLDRFHTLWIQVVKREEPDENFKKEFGRLNEKQKEQIYESAFIYSNPTLYEPANPPIGADQYSINLMWIIESPSPKGEGFLLQRFLQ